MTYCIYTPCIPPTQCTMHHILMADSDRKHVPAISLLNQLQFSSKRSCVVHFLSYLNLFIKYVCLLIMALLAQQRFEELNDRKVVKIEFFSTWDYCT